MRQKMIQAAPAPKRQTKPKSEFEAFDALATKLLKVPKSAVKSTQKPKAGRAAAAKKSD